MERRTQFHAQGEKPRQPAWEIFLRRRSAMLVILLAGVALTSSCGTGASNSSQHAGPLSGNWQFTMTPPPDNSFQGGIQGGFLLQSKGAVGGQVAYSITLPSQPGTYCNSGSATVTGTVNGQNVMLTALAGSETFALTGTLSSNSSTMTGTYTSDGQGCGNAQTGLQWSATSVPSVSGAVQGSFHSGQQSPTSSLVNEDFPVTGFLVQSPNIGASSATVTGTLNFQGYPCVDTASVNGEISGNSVILDIIAANGLSIGQIGARPGTSGAKQVTFKSTAAGGSILLGANGYSLATKQCLSGDIGNVCLGLGNAVACSQPVTLSPASIAFPAQFLGTPETAQEITLTNTDPSGRTLSGLQLTFQAQPGSQNYPLSDFDGLPNLVEQDNCATTPGSTFSLTSQQSCTIKVSFSPQQSCPWIPTSLGGSIGTPPSQCPPFLPALVSAPPALTATISVSGVNSSTYADTDTTFAVPITGLGLSALQPSTPELDFGAEVQATMSTPGEESLPQSVTFTNRSNAPVQILPSTSTCTNPLPRPVTPGSVSGLQVVLGNLINSFNSTISYVCDIDFISHLANFQISNDGCSGKLLAPQQPCSVSVKYAPQPGTSQIPALDDFLELNTNRCGDGSPDCEVDSGRFPVELKANLPSPLRMSPGAGLDFGIQPKGQPSSPLTITLSNDPKDPQSQTVNFTGNIVKGDFAESDDCGTSLAPGSFCTMQITFKPSVIGFDQGTITITYNGGQSQLVHLRGTGQ